MAPRPSPAEQKSACHQAMRALRSGDTKPMAGWIEDHLFGHVLPFWERQFDAQGGLFTCVDATGKVLSTEKWLWSQWRAVWVCSRLHRRLGRDSPWLQRALQIAGFCLRHGWDEAAGGWALLLSQEGKILRGGESIYVDAFAVYGLTELHAVSGNAEMLRWACRTAHAALKVLARPPAKIPHFPYPIPPGAKPHGLPMIWSLILAELGAVSGEQRFRDTAAAMAQEIFRDFYRQDRDLVLEFVGVDGSELPPPTGTVVVPGHVLEDIWFQAHVARLVGQEAVSSETLFQLALRHLERGWDAGRGGGLLLAFDTEGRDTVGWKFADTKLWWPHTEALYTALLGWQQTRRPEFLDWYEKLWTVCLEHFVDWPNGDWRQKLDRSFAPINDVVALPVKDPFHLPRSLILQIELLEKGFQPEKHVAASSG
jgi:N-acylglucosamine 2-epimerase